MDDPRVQALLNQFDTILLVLARPVVQRQLAAFLIIFLISWLLPAPLGRILNRLVNQQSAVSQRRREMGLPSNVWRLRLLRWARGLQLLVFPVVGLAASQLTAQYFASHAWHNDLLLRLASVFWLVLAYRVMGGLLFGTLSPATAAVYQRRFVTPIFLILVGIVVSAGLGGAFPIFDIVLFNVMETPLTVRSVATAVVVFYAFMAAAWVTRDMLQHVVLPRAQAEPGLSNMVLVSTHYSIIIMGILAALGSLGFNLSALAIIGGGLSVGIGFGLQELVANFVSGILLLFEQTLRPGDVIEVGGQRGTVSRLRMRATVLTTIDNIEVFVPNKTLLTSTVSTYTHTDRVVRRIIRVGVSYGSEPSFVRDILQGVVDSHGLVLDDPAPAIYFTGFGESSLDFEIAVWIGDPARILQVLSDLHFMIFSEFTKNGIEIPFPQRDLHIRSVSGSYAVMTESVAVDGREGQASSEPEKQGSQKPDLPG